MAAEAFEMGDRFKLRQELFTEFTFYQAKDEGEDKGEEVRFLMSEFSELKSRGAENEKKLLCQV